MTELNLVKATSQNAGDICKNADLDKASKSLLQDGQSVSDFIQLLLQKHALRDVINILSQALPTREAVYWACLCVRDVLAEKPDPEEAYAIKAAEQWVAKPNEKDRYLNNTIAEKMEYATAAAWVSNAVFWSGGSITTEKEAKVEPPEGVFGKAISGAINLATADQDESKMIERQKRFVKRGINIAQGGKGDNV